MKLLSPPAAATALALGLLVLCPAAGSAKETDSFTHRFEALAFPEGRFAGQPVSDFSPEFNEQFQRFFAEALGELNRENRSTSAGCRSDHARRRLFHRVSNRMGGPVFFTDNRLRPALTSHPNRLPPTDKADSIYRDFSVWGSIALGLAAKLGHNMATQFRFDLPRVLVAAGGSVAQAPDGRLVVLGPEGPVDRKVYRLRDAEPRLVERQGGTYYLLDDGQALVVTAGRVGRLTPILVGSDKISHFFNRSLGLFKRLGSGTPVELDRVLERNFWLEASLYGTKSTGVAAYADLVANFQGVRFWVHLLGSGLDGRPLSDPLTGEAVAPLVDCAADGGWRQLRAFDIRDYLDSAWDEALNCSRLRSRLMADKVRRRIEELGREDAQGRDYTCPVDAGLIAEAAAGYGRLVPWMINSAGHEALRSRTR